jgi:hypothetical protein
VKAITLVVPSLLWAAVAMVAAEPAPPAETLRRVEAASKILETWQGTFLLTTRATISRTDGSKPESDVSLMRMSGSDGGPRVAEVVSATHDGKDVTGKTRADVEKAQAKRDKEREKARGGEKGDDGDGEVSLDLPGPDNAGSFSFTPLDAAGGACGASFAPASAHAGDAGLTAGELRWDCATLDPLSLTARPTKNPRGVSEMSLRFEFVRRGDTVYPARTVTDGVGGILFIKRKFHVETEISELAPAAAETGAGTPKP